MTNRCQFTIIYDLLKVMENRPIKTPLLLLFKRAKISSPYMRTKYLRILETSGLATTTGHGLNTDTADMTKKGIQFIIFYDALMDSMRSGFPTFPHPKVNRFPEV